MTKAWREELLGTDPHLRGSAIVLEKSQGGRLDIPGAGGPSARQARAAQEEEEEPDDETSTDPKRNSKFLSKAPTPGTPEE